MANANLMTHAGAQLATFEELKALPMPTSLGTQHNPIPHALLVEALRVEAQERGYLVKREQFALGDKNAKLFGVMDLAVKTVEADPDVIVPVVNGEIVPETGLSLGFRNSTNQTLAAQIVAGKRVFVCDNLALSGDLIAMLRRNTFGLDLERALREGFNKFLVHADTMDRQIAQLQAREITDLQAKARIFDIFANRIVPVHLFDDVAEFYFNPAPDMTDVQPRTVWGLHNAFTRAMKKLKPAVAFNTNVALGKAFELKS